MKDRDKNRTISPFLGTLAQRTAASVMIKIYKPVQKGQLLT